jgi:hypothetical protein
MHVGPLQIFDELEFEALGVAEFANGCRNAFPPREFRSTVAPRSGYELVTARFAARHRAHEDGLENAVLPDIVGKLGELGFIELAARIGF